MEIASRYGDLGPAVQEVLEGMREESRAERSQRHCSCENKKPEKKNKKRRRKSR